MGKSKDTHTHTHKKHSGNSVRLDAKIKVQANELKDTGSTT